MSSKQAPSLVPTGPTPPKLTSKDLLRQFWADAYGKEVQSAATYSYMWLADQFGHICIGIILHFIATAFCGWAMAHLGFVPKWEYDTGKWPGLIIVVIVAAIWEWSAYSSSVKQATGRFPLDSKLLGYNAIIAATYIALGGLLGFAFHLHFKSALLVALIVAVVAIVLAPWWLRQKIIWQKASLPYLFRLADVAAQTVQETDAEVLQKLIDNGAPPSTRACQVVIGGPIGSGRTPMATGIGTEFAFKNHKVPYLSLDSLLEFSANATGDDFPNDPGPTTISYWPWSECQVVIKLPPTSMHTKRTSSASRRCLRTICGPLPAFSRVATPSGYWAILPRLLRAMNLGLCWLISPRRSPDIAKAKPIRSSSNSMHARIRSQAGARYSRQREGKLTLLPCGESATSTGKPAKCIEQRALGLFRGIRDDHSVAVEASA